jgi:hypothetical protein
METNQFDTLIRRLSDAGTDRRRMLRVLGGAVLGSALGAVAPRLVPPEGVAANPNQKRRPKRRHDGALQAEGKRGNGKGKGKGQNNDKSKPGPKPPPVCDSGKPRCPDGSCMPIGECCPGSYRCSDGFCVKNDACCPGQWKCEYGSCVDHDECCPNERRCSDGSCVSQGACCPGEKLCPNGTCFKNERCCAETVPACTGCDEPICVNGDWECRSSCGDDEDCCAGECLPTCTNGCERGGYGNCGPCNRAPGGLRYCPAQHICIPHCPAGQWLDFETCACVNPCPNGHPETCDGVHPEFDYLCPGGLRGCRCKRTMKGTTHCVNDPAFVSCTKDADCDLAWPAHAGKVVCDACEGRCRSSGCPNTEVNR